MIKTLTALACLLAFEIQAMEYEPLFEWVERVGHPLSPPLEPAVPN